MLCELQLLSVRAALYLLGRPSSLMLVRNVQLDLLFDGSYRPLHGSAATWTVVAYVWWADSGKQQLLQ